MASSGNTGLSPSLIAAKVHTLVPGVIRSCTSSTSLALPSVLPSVLRGCPPCSPCHEVDADALAWRRDQGATNLTQYNRSILAGGPPGFAAVRHIFSVGQVYQRARL